MIEAYPLYWPEGRPRAKSRQHARFDTAFAIARDELIRELERMGARDYIISSNIPVKNNGLPYASAKEPADPGIAVYFTYRGKQHCFACDRWTQTNDNLQAIRLTLQALRGIARWGTGDMMEQAFRGFEALQAPIEQRANWFEVLGVHPNASATEIAEAYRKRAMECHPDRGGTHAQMAAINSAYAAAKAQVAA